MWLCMLRLLFLHADESPESTIFFSVLFEVSPKRLALDRSTPTFSDSYNCRENMFFFRHQMFDFPNSRPAYSTHISDIGLSSPRGISIISEFHGERLHPMLEINPLLNPTDYQEVHHIWPSYSLSYNPYRLHFFLTRGAPGFSGPCPFRRIPRKNAADHLPTVLFQLACMIMAALMSQESGAETVLAGWSDEPNDGNMVIILWLYGNANSLVDWVSMGKLYCIILHPLWGMINVFFKMWWDMAMGMIPI